jgi:hypothetical protein
MMEETPIVVDEPTRKAHAAPDPERRYVYLAGPVEEVDTWRARASERLALLGLEGLDPMRGENIKKVGSHMTTDRPDNAVVSRDLSDMKRTAKSGGLCIMNFNTTKEGRRPGATMCELEYCRNAGIPVIAVIGKTCHPQFKNNPWVNVIASAQVTSVTAALKLIEDYFV